MKLIIAGGRDYELTLGDFAKLSAIPNVSQVVCGGASGADYWGSVWAKKNKIPVRYFRPDWKKYGKKAGPLRNAEMAMNAEACVLFPGGKGTESMFQEASKRRLTIYDWRK